LVQAISGFVDATVILVEFRFSGSRVGDQIVSQLGTLVQLVYGRTEHLILTPIPLRRIEVVHLIGEPLESWLIGLHLRDIIRSKDVVSQKLIVGIQERLHGSGLYVANPGDVLGFALARSDFSFLGSGLLFIRLRSALAFISVALLVSLLFTSFALLGGRLLLSRTRSICLLVSRSRLFSSGQT
jgi:hypothetical protein